MEWLALIDLRRILDTTNCTPGLSSAVAFTVFACMKLEIVVWTRCIFPLEIINYNIEFDDLNCCFSDCMWSRNENWFLIFAFASIQIVSLFLLNWQYFRQQAKEITFSNRFSASEFLSSFYAKWILSDFAMEIDYFEFLLQKIHTIHWTRWFIGFLRWIFIMIFI